MPEDFVTVMHRTALIPASSENPELGGAFIDFLLEAAWSGDPPGYYPFATVNPHASDQSPSLRPIRIGPGLLVYLDDLKRASFSKAWLDAVLRE